MNLRENTVNRSFSVNGHIASPMFLWKVLHLNIFRFLDNQFRVWCFKPYIYYDYVLGCTQCTKAVSRCQRCLRLVPRSATTPLVKEAHLNGCENFHRWQHYLKLVKILQTSSTCSLMSTSWNRANFTTTHTLNSEWSHVTENTPFSRAVRHRPQTNWRIMKFIIYAYCGKGGVFG